MVEIAILLTGGLATIGWVYTNRRARLLLRKQHTFNALLTTGTNSEFRMAWESVHPFMRATLPDLSAQENADLLKNVRYLLNHYEFLAAGIRNGDLDERLLRDSERGSIVALFKVCEAHIFGLRDRRERLTIYEHLEWLSIRWSDKKPKMPQRLLEWIIARPLTGHRQDSQG